jgi:hypothetical protein
MAWPTIEEAKSWCTPKGTTLSDAETANLQGCLDAAVDYLTAHTIFSASSPPSESVRQACMMITSRLYRRRQSPEGIAEFGDSGAIRVYTVDADVRALIAADGIWGIAG